MGRSLRYADRVDDYHHRFQRHPFDGSPLIDETLRVGPVANRERRFARRDQLDAAARAALKDLVLLRQTSKIGQPFVAAPKLE
jgi:hypothetical protein